MIKDSVEKTKRCRVVMSHSGVSKVGFHDAVDDCHMVVKEAWTKDDLPI